MSWSILLAALILTLVGLLFLWVTVIRPAFQNFYKSQTNQNDMDAHAAHPGPRRS